MDNHQNPLPPDPGPTPSPVNQHDLPPELRGGQNGTLTLDSDSGIGVIMLFNARRADVTDTLEEWVRPILDLYNGGLAQPPTYMELLSERDVAIWARFKLDQEWKKFEFSFAGQACAVELATAGEVPVTGRRWRQAALKLEPFIGAIPRTLRAAANLVKEHPLPLDLTAVSIDGYIPDAARSVIFAPWLESSGAEVDPGAMRAYLKLYDEALESCPEGRLAAFVLPEKLTFATRDPEALIEWAGRQAQRDGVSVYLHTGLHALPEGLGQRRGSIATARAAIGVFADIDAWAPGRKKSKETLCPTVADTIKVVERFDELYRPTATTLMIASGKGGYPAILFGEPYLITNDEDRVLLDSLGRRFRLAFHLIASESGWTGAVEGCDLAKVLRLPGTLHRKDPKNPKPVGVLYYYPERRYTLLSLDELLPQLPPDTPSFSRTTKTLQSLDGTLVLDPEARPPADKLEFMLQQSVRFNWTWNHRRSDFKDDDSQSVYDLSLAHQAASFAWTDQEIVNLVIANRREHGGEPKLREDYYRRTIARARDGLEPPPVDEDNAEEGNPAMDDPAIGSEGAKKPTSTEANNDPSNPADVVAGKTTSSNGGRGAGDTTSNEKDASSAGTAPGPASDKKVLLQLLSEILGLPIVRVVKYVGEPASYRIDTKKGTVKIPVIDNLVGQPKLRLAIAEVTGFWFKPFTRGKWHPIAQMLLQACEMEDLGEDATRRGQMIQWLTGYLNEKTIQPTLEAADEGKEPFHDDRSVCIFLSGLKEWLKVRHGERPTDLAAQLKDFGAEHMPSIDVTIRDKKTTRGAWKLPLGPWIPYA